MITYLVNTILCGAVLFLIYILILEREKMHRFNRFYLLFSILFSFGASFITIRSQLPVVPVQEMIMPVTQENAISNIAELQPVTTVTPVTVEKSNIQYGTF